MARRVRGLGTATLVASAAGLIVLASACSLTVRHDAAARQPPAPPTFAAHRAQALASLEGRRRYVSADMRAETEWNLPREWRPAGPPRGGALLVHGLGDSPWSFVDIAPRLAERGLLVRTVLLPGHGTAPADLMGVTLEDWQRVLREQVAALRDTVGEGPLYLGGFSTGANLVLDYAQAHPEVAGLLLVSPALRSGSRWEWLTPWLAPVVPWLLSTGDDRPQQTPVRYLNTPTNGFAQYYRSNVAARAALNARPYDKPALLIVAEHDSVVDSHYVRQVFGTRFTHPSSRLIWYGAGEGNAGADAVVDASAGRVLVRPDRLPAERISQFSHMGVLFSDANPLYGRQGSLRLCLNGQEPAEYRRCVDGGEVWYSDWGYREPGKVHARLTYNPYFAWQTGVMLSVLGLDGSAAPAPESAPATAAATASPAASSMASPTVAPIRSQ
ncbi:alpha/beta hydrolase [Cupriavidus gilardii]|uniref:Alpha/beta hydrolase n=1 Tax=Cupriavidus gilardii TaxID=82541 RepID=A0ABY4VKB9_9BURK|nr:alpha/beta hydrolase [Cupriavidus gilardii]USE77441.1 alpha/beta hydrolase [Cupriavidus gilardii]